MLVLWSKEIIYLLMDICTFGTSCGKPENIPIVDYGE
jgi:hypothetical protein